MADRDGAREVKIIDYRVIPHAEQRYATVGDWYADEDGRYLVRVSALGDWRNEFAVAIHEMIEMALCRDRGVSEAAVDAFDLTHPVDEDPGANPEAPYHREHMFALAVEQLIVYAFGIAWEDHETRLANVKEATP